MAIIKKFEKLDRKDWENFRAGLSQKVSKEEVHLISELHCKYFNHKFQENWLINLRGALGENKSLTENFQSRNL